MLSCSDTIHYNDRKYPVQRGKIFKGSQGYTGFLGFFALSISLKMKGNLRGKCGK